MKRFQDLGLRGVIFDMDGLLFDTETLYLEGWHHVGEAMGIPITREAALATTAIADRDAEVLFQARYGPAFTLDKALPIMANWLTEQLTENGMPLKRGARKLVEFLHKKGVPFALGTSNRLEVAEAYLGAAELRHYFDIVVARDMVEAAKPAPDIFLKAADQMGFQPSECLVLEDSFVGVTAGHAAGCRTVMVPDLVQPCDEIRAKTWQVFDHLEDVHEALFA